MILKDKQYINTILIFFKKSFKKVYSNKGTAETMPLDLWKERTTAYLNCRVNPVVHVLVLGSTFPNAVSADPQDERGYLYSKQRYLNT